MPVDLIFFGLVAAGLIFWLRSILGTRHGDERDRSNPYLKPLESESQKGLLPPPADGRPVNAEGLIAELAQMQKGNMAIANRTAENALLDIARIDRNFDIYKFLQSAQDAFVFIVESFADKDRETLKDLLGQQVYEAFDNAISQRDTAGETMKTEIHSISKSEVTAARLDGKSAFITVRFWAEETSVTHDETGNILHGHPEKSTQMRDLWTFFRDLKSRDPRWLVVETREDGVEDNQKIPNTH